MFKIKDLMIKVIPAEAERNDLGDFGKGGYCTVCTDMDSCGGCTFITCVGCSQCSPPSGGALQAGQDVINPGDLPALKAQLKRRLAVVEAMEKALEPQSMEIGRAS